MIKVLSFPKKKRKTIAQAISVTTAALLIIALTTTTPYATATTAGEEEEEEETTGTATAQEYVNPEFGIRFSYSSDWVFDDYTARYEQSLYEQAERALGMGFIGYLCPEDVAIPSLGGGDSCDAATSIQNNEELDTIGFMRFKDLDRNIALELGQTTRTQQQNLTTDDVFAYYMQKVLTPDKENTVVDDSFTLQEVVSETPFTIPIEDSATGQIVGEASAMLIEYVYGAENIPFGPSFRSYQVFALLDDGETGFTIAMDGTEDAVPSEEVPEELQLVIDTFRFIRV